MSREIKTRENYKDIKVLEKSANGIKRMRQAGMRARETEQQTQEQNKTTPVAYAEDKVAYSAERTVRETAYQVRKSIKTLEREVKSFKKTRQTAKNTVKTTQKAYQAAKTSAKTAERTARVTKNAAKATERATKETAKAIVNVVKATFTATKSLISTIIAGGWVAVFILLIIVLFGAWFAISGGDESEQMEVFSAEVIAYEPLIQQYADRYGMSEYVELIKAVMMQESSGLGTDPMGSSESEYNVKYPRAPNEILEPEYSIYCGVLELKDCLIETGVENPIDIENIRLALRQYNTEVEEYDSLVLRYYIFGKKLTESHI
ncbi:MAG: lysozyme family protein [Tyzzerella sp.]|nr:lysozyme family protein [Tyzzerella sp.]